MKTNPDTKRAKDNAEEGIMLIRLIPFIAIFVMLQGSSCNDSRCAKLDPQQARRDALTAYATYLVNWNALRAALPAEDAPGFCVALDAMEDSYARIDNVATCVPEGHQLRTQSSRMWAEITWAREQRVRKGW